MLKTYGKECLDLMFSHTKMEVPNEGCQIMEVNPMKMVKEEDKDLY